jgi:hypothetical protein
VAQITGHDVRELVIAEVAGIEDRIERVYEWRFNRLMAAIRATSVMSASIVATLATALFEGNLRGEWWLVVVLFAGLSASAAIGTFTYVRLARISREYVGNLSVLGAMRQRTQTRR